MIIGSRFHFCTIICIELNRGVFFFLTDCTYLKSYLSIYIDVCMCMCIHTSFYLILLYHALWYFQCFLDFSVSPDFGKVVYSFKVPTYPNPKIYRAITPSTFWMVFQWSQVLFLYVIVILRQFCLTVFAWRRSVVLFFFFDPK